MRPPRAAVVGGGLGGLTAAGLLARGGCEVTLFEAEPVLGGKAQQRRAGDVVLDAGPTLLTLPHVVRETFVALGAAECCPPFVELETQAEYRWRDGKRFVAHRDLEASMASAAAIAPAEGPALHRFYGAAAALYRAAGEPYLEAPFEGILGFLGRVARRGLPAVAAGLRMGTLDQLAAAHFATPHLRQFVGRFATYTGASPFAVSAAYALIPHLERAYGTHHVRGGVGALVPALAAVLRRLGVRIVTGVRAAWAARGREFLVGSPGDEAVFDVVVVNADPLGERPHGPLALSGYVLLLEVGDRLALPHHLVAFSDDYRREFAELFAGEPADDPTLYLCHPSASDPSMAPPGRSGLFAMVNAPALRPGRADPSPRLRETILARLGEVLPGIAGRTTILGERTPADFARQGAPGGSLYGFLPHGRFGPFRRPRIRGAVPGLFHAGGGTHPGGGVPMVMLSGRFAATLALAHVGLAEAA